MSVELKKKALATLLDVDKENIKDADDITFYADYERYYILSEEERDNMARDVIYNDHDDEWYTIDALSKLLDIDVEDLENYLLAKKMVDDKGIDVLNGKIFVKGYTFKELIFRYMTFQDFIDRCLKSHKEKDDVVNLISEGEEISVDGFFIYTELN